MAKDMTARRAEGNGMLCLVTDRTESMRISLQQLSRGKKASHRRLGVDPRGNCRD